MMFAKFDPSHIPNVLQHFPMKLSGNYARCVLDLNIEDIVGHYDHPVLFLHGTNDKIVNIQYAREAYKYYPNIEYKEIEGGEHMFQGKHNSIAKEYIKNFLIKYR